VRSWRVRAARLFAFLALSVARPPLALAQTAQPIAPSSLPMRGANFRWDKDLVRATYSFSDVLTDAVKQKLSNGPASTIAMRAILFREGDTRAVTVAVQTCVVSYDLWNEVYQVNLTNSRSDPSPTWGASSVRARTLRTLPSRREARSRPERLTFSRSSPT
jgi:hypothetical protein